MIRLIAAFVPSILSEANISRFGIYWSEKQSLSSAIIATANLGPSLG
jgi:hypothetical protein